MNEITIYTKVGCPYCAAAKKHFADENKPFTEVDVHSTPGALDKVKELTKGQNIVPVIVEDGRVTVGFGGG